MSKSNPPNPEELILTMLREVLARQAQQMGLDAPAPPPSPPPAPVPSTDASPAPVSASESSPEPAPPPSKVAETAPPASPPPTYSTPRPASSARRGAPVPETVALETPPDRMTDGEMAQLSEYSRLAAQPFTPGQLGPTLRTLALGLLLVVVLINLPLFGGLAIARALPDRQALIVRDGLLLKGSGPEIYVLENGTKRWISSLDAFDHYGYRWEDVHLVEDAFIQQFPNGRPLHVLLKCSASPHIYRLEDEKKRWIRDIPTFTAEGHVWDDVRIIPCNRLGAIPDGPPIPPDAGSPPP